MNFVDKIAGYMLGSGFVWLALSNEHNSPSVYSKQQGAHLWYATAGTWKNPGTTTHESLKKNLEKNPDKSRGKNVALCRASLPVIEAKEIKSDHSDGRFIEMIGRVLKLIG